MAFWGELGQKITRGSKDALQKTRDMASVVSLNTDISDSRGRIRDLYEELGELVMQNAFTRADREELQKMIDSGTERTRTVELENWKDIFARIISIRSEEEKIALNQQKVTVLRNETKCPGCGIKVAKGTLFCPQCGTKIVWPEPIPEAGALEKPEKAVEPEKAVPDSEPEAVVENTAAAEDTRPASGTAAEDAVSASDTAAGNTVSASMETGTQER